MSEDWTARWQSLVDRIGQLLDGPEVRFGPEVVELGGIRRWLEPLEFDCALHYDAAIARVHGWSDVILPYTAVWAFLLPAVWGPGDAATFGDAARDTQPHRSAIGDDVVPGAPPTSAVFGTGVSMEFARPFRLGERVGAGPRRLLGCEPKRTRVGRGAFVTFERHVVAGDLEPICRTEAQIYLYDPDPEDARA